MKIGIIALSLNKHAVPGFYNSQELGMGKALAAAGHTVTVYKRSASTAFLTKNCSTLRSTF